MIDALEKYIKRITPEMLLGINEDRNYITRDEIEAIKEELREELTRSISQDVTRSMYSGFAAAFMKDSVDETTEGVKKMDLD